MTIPMLPFKVTLSLSILYEYHKNKGINLLQLNSLKTVDIELTEYFQNHGIIKQTMFDL